MHEYLRDVFERDGGDSYVAGLAAQELLTAEGAENIRRGRKERMHRFLRALLRRLCERWGGAGWWGQLRGWAGRAKAFKRRGRGEHPQKVAKNAMHWFLRVLLATSANSAI
jgi:hypothetical protein